MLKYTPGLPGVIGCTPDVAVRAPGGISAAWTHRKHGEILKVAAAGLASAGAGALADSRDRKFPAPTLSSLARVARVTPCAASLMLQMTLGIEGGCKFRSVS